MNKPLSGWTIIGYIFGILLLLASLSAFFQLKIITGVLYLSASCLITPIVFHTLTKNSKIPLTRSARIVITIILIAVAGMFYW